MADPTRIKELSTEYLTKNDPTGWFEPLYREAEEGKSVVPWADRGPNPNLVEYWAQHPMETAGKRAIVAGCGLGDDAELVASWGFQTTAFDISATAIAECKRRSVSKSVDYQVGDLLNPPAEWANGFDFVVESYTLQALPQDVREQAIRGVASLVATNGFVLVICRGRDEQDPVGDLPWPLTRRDLNGFVLSGLREVSFEDYVEQRETGPEPAVRRFRVLYQR